MPTDLLKLPFTIQLAIGAGYLAYLIAYSGIRQHHTTAEAILRSFAFGMIASAIMTFSNLQTIWTALLAFVATISAGLLWRWKGMGWWRHVVRRSGVSWADDIPTAWLSVTATSTGYSPSQVAVEMADGRILLCEDTTLFGDAHEGPVTLGLNGDVALYVTAERNVEGEWEEKQGVRHAYGDLLTYVPASQVKRVELRYVKAAKVSGAVVPADVAAVVAKPA